MLRRWDKYVVGIVVGLVLPLLFGLLYIDQMHLWYAVRTFGMEMGAVWSKLLLVAVFPDLALIFLAYSLDLWKVSKGILIGLFPYLLACIAVSL